MTKISFFLAESLLAMTAEARYEIAMCISDLHIEEGCMVLL
jgi:hypothetical protein